MKQITQQFTLNSQNQIEIAELKLRLPHGTSQAMENEISKNKIKSRVQDGDMQSVVKYIHSRQDKKKDKKGGT